MLKKLRGGREAATHCGGSGTSSTLTVNEMDEESAGTDASTGESVATSVNLCADLCS